MKIRILTIAIFSLILGSCTQYKNYGIIQGYSCNGNIGEYEVIMGGYFFTLRGGHITLMDSCNKFRVGDTIKLTK